MYDYFLLTDNKYNGMVIKKNRDSRSEEYWDNKNNQWLPIGIMINYFWPESPQYGLYKNLNEDQVFEKIGLI